MNCILNHDSFIQGLLSDGTVIAVKQLSSKSKQGTREFLNEVGMISAVQHPNLVKLYGCCIQGNQLLLVYEYMENNCVSRALFGKYFLTLTNKNMSAAYALDIVYLTELIYSYFSFSYIRQRPNLQNEIRLADTKENLPRNCKRFSIPSRGVKHEDSPQRYQDQ